MRYHADTLTMKNWCEVYSGTAVDFDNLTTNMIKLDDIAHALAHICRYNGNCTRHYSVAEHCILMARWVKKNGGMPHEVLTALLHDAAEAYIGDLIRPVKDMGMEEFKNLEAQIDALVAQKFGTIYPLPAWLKSLDARILKDERASIMNTSSNVWGTDALEPLEVKFMTYMGQSQRLMRWMFKRQFKDSQYLSTSFART